MYHIIKTSRDYDGHGYQGPTCDPARVRPGHTYRSLQAARRAVGKLNQHNPVGFRIVEVPHAHRRNP